MYYFENIDNVSVLQRVPSFHSNTFDDGNNAGFDSGTMLIDQVLAHYTDCLLNNEVALRYLAHRGITDVNIIREFRLGFSDRSLGLSLKRLESQQEEATRGKLQLVGLLKPSGHEFFHGSVVFPFIDEDGKVTGGYGRRITHKLRSPSVYHIHWNSNQAVFFNQKALIGTKSIILCKTPLEALSYWVIGFRNVVSTLGLRQFNEHHIFALQQYGVEEVLVAFDNDREGNSAARLVSQALSAFDIGCRRIRYPKESDANDCLMFNRQSQRYFEGLVKKSKTCKQGFSSIKKDCSNE